MDETHKWAPGQYWLVSPTTIDSSSSEDEEPVIRNRSKQKAKLQPSKSEVADDKDAEIEAGDQAGIWPSTSSVVIIVLAIIVMTFSFRDLFFLLVGILLTAAVVFHLSAKRWQKNHRKSRIIVNWEDLKYNYAAVMEKTDTIHSNKGYYINSFSQGLYHHATFDEQIDVLSWVEATEKKLQTESLSQFEKFLKRTVPELEPTVEPTLKEKETSKSFDRKQSAAASSEKMGLQISLRDTSGLLSQLDGLLLKSLEDKSVKELLSEMKSIISDLNKNVEEGFTLWTELDNQTFQKIRKIFSQEPTKNPLALFGLSEENLRQSTPNLLLAGNALKSYFHEAGRPKHGCDLPVPAIEGDSAEIKNPLLNLDWTEFRNRLDSMGDLQIGMGQEIAETIQRLSKLSDDCQKHIQEGAENIQKLKDYFGETRTKLAEIEKEFTTRITVVKTKIKEYRLAVEKLADSEQILKLEYEVRLEIQRLYSIKHSHEVEATGLERRLAEIEAFNASTVEIENTLFNQILEFAEASEDGLLPQVSNCVLSRLQSLMGGVRHFPALNPHSEFLGIAEATLTISTGEEPFKRLLQDQLTEETLQPGEGISDWGECRKVAEFIQEVKKTIFKAHESAKELQLDANHEVDEGIIVNRMSESKLPNISMRDSFINQTGPVSSMTGSFAGTATDSSMSVVGSILIPDQSQSIRASFQSESPSKADWTNNKSKLKLLIEWVGKDKRVLEQCLSILQDQMTGISKIEPRIMKLHRSAQSVQKTKYSQLIGFKRKVFCRFGWWCLGKRVNLKLQNKSLSLVNDALNFLEKELETLYERIYKDESVEKMMSTQAKRNVYQLLSVTMWAEVSLRAICQQTIFTSNFREYIMTTYLKSMHKISPAQVDTKLTLEDAKARQKNIRKGDVKGTLESEVLSASPRPKSSTALEVTEDNISPDRRSKLSIDEFLIEPKDNVSQKTPELKASYLKTPEPKHLQTSHIKSQTQLAPIGDDAASVQLDTLNKMFSTFFKEWAVNSYFERYVSKKIKKQLNKDRLSCFEEFSVTSFKMDSKPFRLKQLQPQASESFEFLADADVEYDGLISINIESTLNVNLTVKEYKLKVNVAVKIFQIFGVIRVCLVPLRYGKSW